jgi:predicted neuraminidase
MIEALRPATSDRLLQKRSIMVTNNLERYPADLQPWGAHASSVALLDDGTILVNWYGGTCSGVAEDGAYKGDPNAASRVYIARLPASAERFEEPEVLGGDGIRRYMDANLYVDTDRIWAFYVRDGGTKDTVVCRYALDSQATSWSPETPVSEGVRGRVMNPPIRVREQLLLPVNAFDKTHGPWRDVILLSSSDSGASWQQMVRIEATDLTVILREPTLVQVEDEIHMYARVRVHTSFWEMAGPLDARWRVHRSISRDGGITWTPPEPTALPNFDSKVHIISLGGKRLLAAYNASRNRYPLFFAISDDAGETWEEAGHVDLGPGEMSYPTLLLGPDGRLHMSYTWKRREIMYKEYEIIG